MLVFLLMLFVGAVPRASAGTVLQGIDLGNLPDYLFGFLGTGTSGNFNMQGATPGFQGDIAVNAPVSNVLSTSGSVPYQGTMITNGPSLGAWQTGIINNNNLGGSFPLNNAVGITGQSALIAGLQTDLQNALTQLLPSNLAATPGFTSVSAQSLNGLDERGNPNKLFVINITSGLSVSSNINIFGDPDQIFVLRWSTNPLVPYQGQVKFGGGAIVPQGGLIPTNFINVAGDLNSSGGGTNPLPPYPQGVPIQGGSTFNNSGFFTGYWLTTGNSSGRTSSLSNGVFVGGWYTTSNQFSLTSGSAGVYDPPPQIPEAVVPEPSSIVMMVMGLGTVGLVRARLRRFRH
jgi:hypothetical protein